MCEKYFMSSDGVEHTTNNLYLSYIYSLKIIEIVSYFHWQKKKSRCFLESLPKGFMADALMESSISETESVTWNDIYIFFNLENVTI